MAFDIDKSKIDYRKIAMAYKLILKSTKMKMKMKMREITSHNELLNNDGAIASLRFEAQKGHFKIPGEHDLTNAQGLKYKAGILHLSYDEEEDVYYVYLINDVVSSIDILPNVAAPYVEKGLVAIFKGMFDL